MSNRKISQKALIVWLCGGMMGPVAIAAARSAWIPAILAGLLCSVLCAVIHSFSNGEVWQSRVFCILAALLQIVLAAVLAGWAGLCWSGSHAEKAVPLILLALAGISARNGGHQSVRVGAAIMPLCALVFGVVLAAGITNIRPERIPFTAAPLEPWLPVAFLLPLSATLLPRDGAAGMTKMLLSLTFAAGLIAVSVTGTLSMAVALRQKAAFYEFSKTLSLFGFAERFESVAAVGVTLSVFAMLSMLLSGVGHAAEKVMPGKGRWGVAAGTAAAAGWILLEITVSGEAMGIVAVAIWGICPVIVQGVQSWKKGKNREKSA